MIQARSRRGNQRAARSPDGCPTGLQEALGSGPSGGPLARLPASPKSSKVRLSVSSRGVRTPPTPPAAS